MRLIFSRHHFLMRNTPENEAHHFKKSCGRFFKTVRMKILRRAACFPIVATQTFSAC